MPRIASTTQCLSRVRSSILSRAFTLLEILLATVLLISLIAALVINFSDLSDSARYKEAKESLKTLIISKRYEAAYKQKPIEVDLSELTNELNIVDASRIVFFSDGSTEESYIIISSLDGKITNKIIINVIGYVSENNDIPVIESKDNRLPIDYEDIKVD